MADSSTNPAPQRDSVDETSPLLPGASQAQTSASSTRGPVQPSAPEPPNEPVPALFGINGAIIAIRVLFAVSATSFLLGIIFLVTYLARKDGFELHWNLVESFGALELLSFLCIFLSVTNLIILTQARRRNETSPSVLGALINVAALGLFCYWFVIVTSVIVGDLSWDVRIEHDAIDPLLLLWLAVGVVLGWAVVPGMIIFWLRGLIIWIWNTGSSITWPLPGGQLTVEASIKFHRQEPRREAQESA